MVWGEYPAFYKPEVHGPYHPARYYGPKDTKFTEVKLADLGAWLARRDKSPNAMIQAVSRAHWRWRDRYQTCIRGGIAFPCQVIFGLMAFFYTINYHKFKALRKQKYHW